MTNHNAELPTENQTPTAQSGTSDRAIAEVVRKMAATGWEANSYSTCYEGKRILVAAAEIDNIEPPAGARDAVAWPARFGCNGPEGSFWTDDSALANKLIAATYDRDEWTVTDTTNPTGISSKLVVDTQPAATGAGEYDRELIAKMLGRLIGLGNKLSSYSYQSIKDQIRLLREADNRYVARAHTVIKGEAE